MGQRHRFDAPGRVHHVLSRGVGKRADVLENRQRSACRSSPSRLGRCGLFSDRLRENPMPSAKGIRMHGSDPRTSAAGTPARSPRVPPAARAYRPQPARTARSPRVPPAGQPPTALRSAAWERV